ncbi:DgaE family pyridoxal phosphate-dependent ammonia lyase [Streptomyces sp. NPDC048172]|uniref:DgaE family pyridoxal phosphate-dependent ammonia lyase n=1 Tax=Streptomyces sp. NPDC048172 TaxID=3365505 RepID=UPI0037226C7B
MSDRPLDYHALGVHPAVNANGKMTALGGSRLSAATIAAMGAAARDHVVMDELMTAVGHELAAAAGTEDACPTTGAASGVALAVAALVAGADPARIERLPDPGDRPCEVVLPKGHAVNFGAPVAQMIALGGGTPVEAGAVNKVRAAHLEGAIGARTAALLYVQSHHAVQKGAVSLAETVAVGRAHGVPVIVDAAAEEDLRKWPATGADLVVYSGGKAIGGPTSGFVCGPAPLIAAVRAQYTGIGRPMKVGKETLLGLAQAVREYGAGAAASGDEDEDAGAGADGGARARMERLAGRLGALRGLSARVVRDEAGREIFRAELTVDPERAGRDAAGLAVELAAGTRPVFLRDHHAAAGRLAVDPRALSAEEEEHLAHRLTELLGGAAAGDDDTTNGRNSE